MEKQVTLSGNSWHSWVVNYVFGVDPETLTNLCLYFWLTLAGIFLVIPTFIYRILSYPFRCLKNFWEKKKKENFLDSLTPAQLYFLRHSTSLSWNGKKGSDRFYQTYLDMSLKDQDEILEETMKRRGLSLCDIDSYKSEYEFQGKKLKKDIAKVVGLSKDFINVSIVLLGISAIYGLSILLMWCFFLVGAGIVNLGLNFTIPLLMILAVPFLVGGFMSLFKYSFSLCEKGFSWTRLPIYILLSPVFLIIGVISLIKSIALGFKEGIIEFGGLFGEYLNSSYSDYCPKINWKKK